MAARLERQRRIAGLPGRGNGHPEVVRGDLDDADSLTAADLSDHMRSRTAVGEILLESGIETVVLQAGIVVGSGSASFEMIRHLTRRLPVMTTPKWVRNKIQPIAVHDVLHYLAEAAAATVPSPGPGTSADRTSSNTSRRCRSTPKWPVCVDR